MLAGNREADLLKITENCQILLKKKNNCIFLKFHMQHILWGFITKIARKPFS